MNSEKNTESFLSSTMRSAESIVSNGKASAKHYLEVFRDYRDTKKRTKQEKQIAPMAKNAPGNISAHLMLVGGWIVLVLAVLIGLVELVIFGSHWQSLLLTLFIPIVLGVALIVSGIMKLRYVETYQIYRVIFTEKPYISIARLAQRTQTPKRKVIKYLDDFEANGLFPSGHFYQDDMYYVLSDRAEELLEDELEISRERRQRQDLENELESEYPKLYAITTEIDESLEALDGLNESKTAANNPELSRELSKMRKLLRQIRSFILQNPADVPDIRGFMDYFLPTVTKLLGTYYELDNEMFQTDNILASKAEIESVLGSINTAFENMYDDFYTDRSIDIYADVSVLKSLINKQGFSESDFKQE